MADKPPSVLARLGAAIATAAENQSQSPNQRKRRTVSTTENASPDRDSGASPAGGAAKRARLQAATPKDAMARSRRMFGALMGHLGKAKAQIERDSALIKRQDARQLAAERKEQRQSRSLEERAKRAAAVLALEKLLTRTAADRKEQLARAELEHQQQARKSARLAGFLQTVASPAILYLPAKHTKETEDLVAAAKEAHDAKAQTASRDYETRVRDLERAFDAKLEQYREQLAEAKQRVKEEEEERGGGEKAKTAAGDKATEAAKAEEKAVVEKGEEDAAMDANDAGEDEEDGDRSKLGGKEEEDAKVVEEAEDDGEAMEQKASENSSSGGDGDGKESDDVSASPARPSVETSSLSVEASASDESVKTESVVAPTAASEDAGDEKSVGDVATATESNGTEDAETPPPVEEEPVGATIDVSALKVTELREQLKKRGLDTKGLKAALVARLEDAMRQDASA